MVQAPAVTCGCDWSGKRQWRSEPSSAATRGSFVVDASAMDKTYLGFNVIKMFEMWSLLFGALSVLKSRNLLQTGVRKEKLGSQ